MKIIAVSLVALSFAAAASAASARPAEVSDVDYLQASRCAGIAAGLNSPDAAALKAYVDKAEGYRAPFVLDQGQQEFDNGKRRANGDHKAKAQAELAGVCAAYVGGVQHAAATGARVDAVAR